MVIVFAVGSTDRIFYRLHISYTSQIYFWRVGIWVLPVIIFFITRSAARGLRRSETHPLRGWEGQIIRREEDGGTELLAASAGEPTDSENL